MQPIPKCQCGSFGSKRLCNLCAEKEFKKLSMEAESDEPSNDSIDPKLEYEPPKHKCQSDHSNRQQDLPPARAKFIASRRYDGNRHLGFDGLEIEYRLSLRYSNIPSWKCPNCGFLNPRYPPLEGENNQFHCSTLDCDEIVEFFPPQKEMMLVRTAEKYAVAATIWVELKE